jgi:integrase
MTAEDRSTGAGKAGSPISFSGKFERNHGDSVTGMALIVFLRGVNVGGHRAPHAKDDDYVFPSFRLKGKKPLSASIMVQKYLRPAAVKAGVIKEDQQIRFGFHNFRHSLASSLVKLKCDPKTVQGILRHEDVRTTMQLYAQSDQESRLEAQGKFLALLLGDKAHRLMETIQ